MAILVCNMRSRGCLTREVHLLVHQFGVSGVKGASAHDIVGAQSQRVHPVSVSLQCPAQHTLKQAATVKLADRTSKFAIAFANAETQHTDTFIMAPTHIKFTLQIVLMRNNLTVLTSTPTSNNYRTILAP